MTAVHYLVLAFSGAAACGLVFKGRERLAGLLVAATGFLGLADWILLLARDTRAHPTGFLWLTCLDAFIIIGIAWIPCYILLRLPLARLRLPVHTLGSVAAVWWIFDHTPTHAISPAAGPDTAALTVAFCVMAFAVLNWAMILRPAATRSIGLRAGEIAWLRVVTAIVMAAGCASLGGVAFRREDVGRREVGRLHGYTTVVITLYGCPPGPCKRHGVMVKHGETITTCASRIPKFLGLQRRARPLRVDPLQPLR